MLWLKARFPGTAQQRSRLHVSDIDRGRGYLSRCGSTRLASRRGSARLNQRRHAADRTRELGRIGGIGGIAALLQRGRVRGGISTLGKGLRVTMAAADHLREI